MTPDSADKFCVPILSNDKIETIATAFNGRYQPLVLVEPMATPLVVMIEELRHELELSVDYATDLGETQDGHKILGVARQSPLSLSVDASLMGDPRYRFVLGHELCHILLHRSVDLTRSGYAGQRLDDTERDFVTGKKKLKTPRDFIEWQANRFSSALLLPGVTFRKALLYVQKDRGISRNLGKVYVDSSPSSIKDFYAVRRELQVLFDVTGMNVECRLRDMDMLDDHRGGMSHISLSLLSD